MAEAILGINKGLENAVIAWVLLLLGDRIKVKNSGCMITFYMSNGKTRNGPHPLILSLHWK